MRSLQVAFSVLEAVAKSQPVGVSELARILALPKTTVQRSLIALAEVHYIVPAEGSRWQLSSKVLTLTSRLELPNNLLRAATPAMSTLCEQVGETIHLTIREGRSIVLIGLVEPPRSVRTTAKIGNMRLAHTTSTGKVMLASLTDDEVSEIVGPDLEKVTERTIDSLPKLLKLLARIRQLGYAVNDREYNLETASVAAGIKDWEGRTIAALSISAPASRLKKALWTPYGELVAEVAATIRV